MGGGVGRVGSQWGRSEGTELEGENKRGEGENKVGWSRVVKFLNSPERPQQGKLSSFFHRLLHPPQYKP